MIDMNKTYTTRDGCPVRLLCVDGPDTDYPVIGIIKGDSLLCQWTGVGAYNRGFEGEVDLIEVVSILWGGDV